jgi:hypothetical protein
MQQVSAFVASMNMRLKDEDKNKPMFTKWFSQAVKHEHNDKFYANLQVYMKSKNKIHIKFITYDVLNH